jgi:hypothetical protein
MDPNVVEVTHLFPPERASPLELLGSLDAERWQAPTVCPDWSVRDVALHLLGDDIGLLARRRDGFAPAGAPAGWRELVAWLDRMNQTWVEAARRISPRLLCELLAFTGEATWQYLAGLDPLALEGTSPGWGRIRSPTGWTWRVSTPSGGRISSRSARRSACPGCGSPPSWRRYWRPLSTRYPAPSRPCRHRSGRQWRL